MMSEGWKVVQNHVSLKHFQCYGDVLKLDMWYIKRGHCEKLMLGAILV